MDAFDRIAARIPDSTKRRVGKNLAISSRIIDILEAQGKTRRDLANALGRSESLVSRWLTGMHNLELNTVYKIEDALGEEIISIVRTEDVQSSITQKEIKTLEVVSKNESVSKKSVKKFELPQNQIAAEPTSVYEVSLMKNSASTK